MTADSAIDSPLTPSADAAAAPCGGKESEGGAENTGTTTNPEITSSSPTITTRAQDDEGRNPSPTTEAAPGAVAAEAADAATPCSKAEAATTATTTIPTPYNHGDALTHLVLGGGDHEDDIGRSPGEAADSDGSRCAEYSYGGAGGAGADPYATDDGDDSSEDGEIVFRARKTVTAPMEICSTPPTTSSAAARAGSGGSSSSSSSSNNSNNSSSRRSGEGGSTGKNTPSSVTSKDTPSSATSTSSKKTPSSNASRKTRAERLAAVAKSRQRFSGTKSLKKILGRISPGGSNSGSSGGAKGSPPNPTTVTGSNSNDVPVPVVPVPSADGSPSSSPKASPSAVEALEMNPSMRSIGSESTTRRASSSPGSASNPSPPKSFPEDDVATSGGAILDATTCTPTATPIAIKATPEVDDSVTKYFSSLIKGGESGKGGTSRKKSRSPPDTRTCTSGSSSPSDEGKVQQDDTLQLQAEVTLTSAAKTSSDDSSVPNSPKVSEDTSNPPSLPAVVSVPASAQVVAASDAESPPLALTSESNDVPPFAGGEAKTILNLPSAEPSVTCEQKTDAQEAIGDMFDTASVCVPTSTLAGGGKSPIKSIPAAKAPPADRKPTSSTSVLDTPLIVPPSKEPTETAEESSEEESPLVTPMDAGTTQTETVRREQSPPTIPSLTKKPPTPDNEMGDYFDALPSKKESPDANANENETSTGTAYLTKSFSAPRVGTDDTRADGGESAKQVDLLSGLSTKYSPSQHMPKYSETELKAKIDAALLKAEREWTQKVKLENSGGAAAQKRFDELKNEHESEMKRIVREHNEKIEDQRRTFEEKRNEVLPGGTLEQMQQTISSLKEEIEEDKANFESNLQKQREAHEADIKDLEERVNDMVADSELELTQLREKLTTKETMIDSLGQSLKEAQEKKSELESRYEMNQERIDQLRVQMEEDRKVAASLEEEMERQKADHDAALRKEEARRMAACDEVRKETIRDAEVQFAKANDEYKRIKSKYSVSMKSVRQLESDLKEAKSRSDSLAQEQKLKEKKMLAEVAQLEAKFATAEANTASVSKKYTMEIAEMKERERKLTINLEDAARDREAANTSLSTIIAEKERLKKDNKDLNEMCEQLLAMAEQGTK